MDSTTGYSTIQDLDNLSDLESETTTVDIATNLSQISKIDTSSAEAYSYLHEKRDNNDEDSLDRDLNTSKTLFGDDSSSGTDGISDDEISDDENDGDERPTGDDRPWNWEFKKIWKLDDNDINKYLLLAELAEEFLQSAKLLAMVIVNEQYASEPLLPASNVGGIAGGKKYIKKGILFKFVTDTQFGPNSFMYGGAEANDAAAFKAAGHELKGLTAVWSCITQLKLPIFVPLMCLIDYRGFRLIAVTMLPIGKNTLVYGSCDGGKTVMNEDENMSRYCERLFGSMNLKLHVVGREVTKILNGPGDIEGHRGLDNDFYLLDFARVFPPEDPIPNSRDIFYKMLRQELVRSNRDEDDRPLPLSSDGFSGWQIRDPKSREHNNEIRAASRKLYHVKIPDFATELGKSVLNLPLESIPEFLNALKDIELVKRLHSAGINVRHLGLVLKHVAKEEWRMIIRTEMVARVLKNEISERLRTHAIIHRSSSDHAYKRVIVDFFNSIFGLPKTYVNTFWAVTMKDLLVAKFHIPQARATPGDFLTDSEQSKNYDFTSSVYLCYLFRRLEDMMNLRLDQRFHDAIPTPFQQQKLRIHGTWQSTTMILLTLYDVVSLPFKSKHLPFVEMAAGTCLIDKMWTDDIAGGAGIGSKANIRTLEVARKHVQNALQHLPNEPSLNYKLAQTFYLSVMYNWEPKSYYSTSVSNWPDLTRAKSKFEETLQLNPDHIEAQYYLGILTIVGSNYAGGCDLLRRAMHSDQRWVQYSLDEMKRLIEQWNGARVVYESPLVFKGLGESVLEIAPGELMAHVWLANMYWNVYDWEDYFISERIVGSQDKGVIITKFVHHIEQVIQAKPDVMTAFIDHTYLAHSTGRAPWMLFMAANKSEVISEKLMDVTKNITSGVRERLSTSAQTPHDVGETDYQRFFPKLESIALNHRCTESELKEFPKHCQNLTTLVMNSCNRPSSVEVMNVISKLPNLTSLEFSDIASHWAPSTSQVLGSKPLKVLKLKSVAIQATQLHEILQLNKGQLTEICLENIEMEESTLDYIGNYAPQLKSLKVHNNGIKGTKFLNLCNALTQLESIDLEGSKFDKLVILALNELPSLKSLTLFGFTKSVDDEQFNRLKDAKFATCLEELSLTTFPGLSSNPFAEIADKFCNLRKFRLLQQGNLRNPEIASSIAKFTNLEDFFLGFCGGFWLSDQGYRDITANCKKITTLTIDSGINSLLNASLALFLDNCENLTYLDISNSRSLSEGWTKLFSTETCVVKYKDASKPGLTTLKCSQVKMSLDGILDITSNHPNLSYFQAHLCLLSDAAFRSITTLSKLRYLGISPGMFQSPDMLVSIIDACEELQELDLQFSLMKLQGMARRKLFSSTGHRNIKINI